MTFRWRKLPTYHAYLAMLGIATSANHLERLHHLLPPNVRLLRDDWIKFVDFWQRHFTGERAEEHRDQLQQWLLYEQSIDWGKAKSTGDIAAAHQEAYDASTSATGYYIARIRREAMPRPLEHFPDDEWGSWHRIIGCEEGIGHGDEQFKARLFDAAFSVSCHLTKCRKHLLVRFKVRECMLTEELTHKILELPTYYLPKHGVMVSSSVEGTYLHLSYELDGAAVAREWPRRIASEKFCQIVADLLRAAGVPVSGALDPVIYQA